jgi:hypothetical protein
MPANKAKQVTVSINPQNQNLETVHRIVANILRRADCDRCGRLALLDAQFFGDPGPDLAKDGVISVHTQLG